MPYTRTSRGKQDQVLQGATALTATRLTPNNGFTVITNATTAADIYVLEPPVSGCRKTLIFNTALATASELPVVNTVTVKTAGINFMVPAGGSTGLWQLNLTTLRALTSSPVVVELLGINSTAWVITSVSHHTSTAIASVNLSS